MNSNKEVLENLGKILLKDMSHEMNPSKKMKSLYGSAPITYDKLIFFDKEKEKEWHELDPSSKAICLSNLKEACSKMENKIAIELLCHVINDLIKRMEKLESYTTSNS